MMARFLDAYPGYTRESAGREKITWFLALSARIPLLKNEAMLRAMTACSAPYMKPEDAERVSSELKAENERLEYGPRSRALLTEDAPSDEFIDGQWNMLRMRI
jgi:hypothetical protein